MTVWKRSFWNWKARRRRHDDPCIAPQAAAGAGRGLSPQQKTGKARSQASAVGYALLFAVLVVVLMLCFAGMALPLASVLLPAGLDWLYFASMGLTALLVSVLASAFTSYSGLFQSRDNELLLSLPIPPAVIFGVRMSTVYLACLIYLLMAWVPAVVCYGLLAAHPLAGVLCSIPMALVLAGAACILAVLLGWAVALANDRARHKSLVTVVCSLVFFALYYAGFLRVQEMLDDLLADAAQSGAALARAAWPLRLLGSAAAGELPALVGLVLGTVLCFAAFCKLLEKPYLRRMTARKGTARTAYHARKARPVSLRQALLRRELLHLGSSSAYMLNSAMGTLGLLVLGGVSLWKADLFARFAQAVPEGVPVLVCCAVCAVSAANFLTTPSVSLEGRTVWLLQSLPIPSWQALCAKLELHLLLTGVPAALCLVCMQAAVQMPPVYFCLTLLEAELFVLLSAEMGLALGLVLPNLHWTSEAAVTKMSGCTLLSMAANLVAVLVLTLAQTNLLTILPLPAVMAAALVLLAGADGLLGHWLKTRGARRLAELS